MKNKLVLAVLFILPIVIYLFFATGITNFGKLANLTEKIADISSKDEVLAKGKITVLGFLGNEVENKKGNAFNLNQKIYKRFYEFNDFQFVMVMPKGTEQNVEELKKELGNLTDVGKWNFVYGNEEEIKIFFDGENRFIAR